MKVGIEHLAGDAQARFNGPVVNYDRPAADPLLLVEKSRHCRHAVILELGLLQMPLKNCPFHSPGSMTAWSPIAVINAVTRHTSCTTSMSGKSWIQCAVEFEVADFHAGNAGWHGRAIGHTARACRRCRRCSPLGYERLRPDAGTDRRSVESGPPVRHRRRGRRRSGFEFYFAPHSPHPILMLPATKSSTSTNGNASPSGSAAATRSVP